jgi:hypothetical protein
MIRRGAHMDTPRMDFKRRSEDVTRILIPSAVRRSVPHTSEDSKNLSPSAESRITTLML